LLDIPEHFSNTEIDFYIFMSDHTHLILVITDTGGACPAATKRPSLGSIIGSFKAAASRLVGKSLWQPNYYEHIIRSESCLDRIRDYILRNPCMEYDEINWRLLDPSL
jgi:REP element-mobilizing transposase RayT